MNSQRGFSLTELMVALTIGLLLLGGVIQVFVSSKRVYHVSNAWARLQEHTRFLNLLVSREVRMGGFAGCASTNVSNIADANNDGMADSVANLAAGLAGFEYADLPMSLAEGASLTAASVVSGTDILQVRSADPTDISLVGNLSTANANVQLDAAAAAGMFSAGDTLVISDCTAADVFVASGVSSGAGKITIAHANSANLTNNLSKPYGTDARVMGLRTTTYYIGVDPSGEPGLFRARFTGKALANQLLVPGVEQMQVLYGEDTDGDGSPNRYLPSSGVGNMDNVTAVRLGFVVRSPDGIRTANDGTTHNLLGVTLGPYSDRRVRQVHQVTVTLRNRSG